jgi:MFS family permease
MSMITTFQLYILTDYAGVYQDEAAGIVTVAAVLNLVASIIASLLSGRISDRMGRRRAPVVLASVLIAVATLVPLVFAEGWAMLVFATLAGFGAGIYYAVDVALMTEVLPDRQTHSRDLGILNISNTGAQALGPGASSLLVAIGLGFAPVFVVSMVVVLVGGASTLLIRSVR